MKIKWTKRAKTIVLAALMLLLLICALTFYRLLLKQDSALERFPQAAPKAEETTAGTSMQPSPEHETVENEPLEAAEPYQSPVDFQLLMEANPDIYAWLDIPGTDISYPLLQRTGDNTFYMTHDAEGNKNQNGALFTEGDYNEISFTDPVTVVYGHNMRNGLMYGRLQGYYTDSDCFTEYHEVIVYLPDRELHFEVFAAVPYDNRHILHNYDFTDRRTFRLVFDNILLARAIEANFSEDATVSSDEQVLILSTCLIGNRTKRFLVCAKLSDYE